MSCSVPTGTIQNDKAPPLSDHAYLQASAIFQQLREEKPVTHELLRYAKKTEPQLQESGDRGTQRQAYQLAFNTLKYQDLLEEIIAESCLQTSQHISADLLPLVMVMLWDLQDRSFVLQERSPHEQPVQEVRELESSLHRCKTKLAASLARCRVKLNLQSVSCFLSDSVRNKQHFAKRLPIYAWVNTLKMSVEEVCDALHRDGLCEKKDVVDLDDRSFCRDVLCPDTLVFSQQLRPRLQDSSLTGEHVLNIQDRSICLAVSALRPLLFEHNDVLVVGSFSPVTVAHVAVVASARSARALMCGADHSASQLEEIQERLKDMSVSNVRILSEAFCGLSEGDTALQRVKVVVVLPQCSSSALNDPVPVIHSEHGDWDLLPDLSHGQVSKHKIHTMSSQQSRLLAHALTFSKVQTVVYCTRSVYPEENEQLVKRVLEKTHTHPKLLPFRVNGPVFPDDSQLEDKTDSKFFRLGPSRFTNGCFVARLSRQADPTKVETVQDVLARAAAKGLLGGILPEQLKPGKKAKSKKDPRPPSPNQDPTAPVEGEGDLTKSDKEEESQAEEEEAGKEEEQKKTSKGRKRKVKRRGKQTSKDPKNDATGQKKKAGTKANQSHHSRRLTKSKKRRIPRLTLTLMSSEQPSKDLSPITALAHRISENQQTAHSAPSSAAKHPSPARAAPSTAPAACTQTIGNKPTRPLKTRTDLCRPDQVSDYVLPPISRPSSSSGSSTSQRQPANTSAPSTRPPA